MRHSGYFRLLTGEVKPLHLTMRLTYELVQTDDTVIARRPELGLDVQGRSLNEAWEGLTAHVHPLPGASVGWGHLPLSVADHSPNGKVT